MDYSQLRISQTVDAVQASVLRIAADLGFPVTSWFPGGVARTLTRIWARGISDQTKVAATVADGLFLDVSTGLWLRFIAKSFYRVTAYEATATEGYVLVSNASGSTQTWSAGGLVVVSAGGYQYENTADVSISSGSSTSVLVRARVAGSSSNAGNGTISSATVGSRAGVAISNPVYTADSWIVAAGRDAESDASIRIRCKMRWATTGAGGTIESIRYWCLSSGLPTIVKANVWKSATDTISITVGSTVGAPDPAEYATFQTYMDRYRPALCTFSFATCTTYAVYVGGQIQVKYSDLASAQTQFELRMTEFFGKIPIGGTVRINELIATIWGVPGVQSLVLRNSSGALYAQTDDVALTSGQLATYTNAMTWVTV